MTGNFRRNLRNELDFFGVSSALRSALGYVVPSVRRPQRHQEFLSRYETGAPYRGRFRPSFAPSQRFHPPPPHRQQHPATTPRPAVFLTPAPLALGTGWAPAAQFGPRLPPPARPLRNRIREPGPPAVYLPLEENYNYELEIKVSSTAATTTDTPPPPPPPPPTAQHPRIAGNGFWPNRQEFRLEPRPEELHREFRLEATPEHPSEGLHKIVVKVEEQESGSSSGSVPPAQQSFFGPTSFGLPWDKHTRRRKRKRKKDGGSFAPEATAPASLFTAPASLSYDDYLHETAPSESAARGSPRADAAGEEAAHGAHPESNTPFPEFGQRLRGWQRQQAQSVWRRMGTAEDSAAARKRARLSARDDGVSESPSSGFAFYRPQRPSQFRQQLY